MKRSDRSKSLSDRNVRELKRLVLGEHRMNMVKITTDMDMNRSTQVSKYTMHRYLKKLGYEYAIKVKRSNG